MKKAIALCILTALMLTGCAQMPVQPAPAAPEAITPSVNETTPVTETTPAAEIGTEITEEDAKNLSLSHAGLTADQVTFVKGSLDLEDGRRVYDMEFYTEDFREYDYEIDAATGEVLSFDSDAEFYAPPATTSDSAITEEDAKALAIAKVPGAALTDIREFKTDRDDGRLEYEGTIVYDKTEYEFEINAATGEFLSWEAESVFD